MSSPTQRSRIWPIVAQPAIFYSFTSQNLFDSSLTYPPKSFQPPIDAPPQWPQLSSTNAQLITSSSPTQLNLFDGSPTDAPYFISAPPAPMSVSVISNTPTSNDPMDFVSTQSHGLTGEMVAGYNNGHAANLQHEMYDKRQPTRQNEKKFKCNQCSRFSRSYDLNWHTRIYLKQEMDGKRQPTRQNEKNFECDQCSSRFSRPQDLKKHKWKHSRVKVFHCQYCEKKFVYGGALRVSLSRVDLAPS